jgi:hypothetical protein
MRNYKVNDNLPIVFTFGGNGSDAFTTELAEQSPTAGWVPGVLVMVYTGFLSGFLSNSNVAAWVLPNQDSNTAPQTLQDA